MKTEVNGIGMSFLDEGEGPLTLLLLHAFPLSGEMWRPQLDALAGEARLLVPDLRGFGGTDAPAGAYSLYDMAADVVALMDRRGVEKAVVCGLSMGGYLAFALLRRARERVRGLILADTKAGADTEEARANRYVMAETAEREGSGPIVDAMPEKLLGETTRATRPEVIGRVKDMIRANSGAGIAGAQRAMAARPDSTDLLPSVNLPALVIVGEEDTLTPPAEAERMESLLPQGRCAVITQAGHLSNLEQPELFNGHVREFLRGL